MLTKFTPLCWHLSRPSSSYRGCFPKFFEKRFLKVAQVDNKRVLHLFYGKSKLGGIRVDLKAENKPNVIADCHHLPFRDNIDFDFDAVPADLPYVDRLARRLNITPGLKQVYGNLTKSQYLSTGCFPNYWPQDYRYLSNKSSKLKKDLLRGKMIEMKF